MRRRLAAALTQLLLVPTAAALTGCAAQDDPATTIENNQEGNVGGITPEDLKKGAEQYQTDLSGLNGIEGAPTDTAEPATP